VTAGEPAQWGGPHRRGRLPRCPTPACRIGGARTGWDSRTMTTALRPVARATALAPRRRRVDAGAAAHALAPAAALLTLISLQDAPPRAVLVLGLPVLALAFTAPLWPRGLQVAGGLWLGALGLGAGLIAHSAPAAVAGAAVLAAAGVRGWGINRGRPLRRAGAVALGLAGVVALYPALTAADFLAKPRRAISETALGLPHQAVAFRASDGVRLSGWWVPGRNGAAVIVVHGGGGDRGGAVAHARMLARAGYGVLLYDARGRGRSGGRQNALGWRWDRDVRGAVDAFERRGIHRIGLLGLSTGAEAAVTEAAGDPRVGAVIADGVQVRTSADAAAAPAVRPLIWAVGTAVRAVGGERPPAPLLGLVRRLAATRPLLMVATIAVERTVQRRYARGTSAEVWQLPRSGHTQGLRDHPAEYARRVGAVLARGLGA